MQPPRVQVSAANDAAVGGTVATPSGVRRAAGDVEGREGGTREKNDHTPHCKIFYSTYLRGCNGLDVGPARSGYFC